MDYYVNMCYNGLNEKDKFFKFLSSLTIDEMKKISEGDKLMEEITEEVVKLNSDPDIIKELEDDYDYMRIYNTDMKLARDEAVEEGKKEVALNLINEGADADFIAKVTKLDKNQIESLYKEKNNKN